MRSRPAPPALPPAIDLHRLQIVSSRLVTSIFAGDYRSVFRGRGIEFEQVREYQPGDDVRSIDWNVTARAGRPFVKEFVEERELTVLLLLDQSPSLRCATPGRPKSMVAAEVCALLAFAAARSHDRVGLLRFTDRIESYVPAAKGLRHAQRLVAEIGQPPTLGRGTDLALALDHVDRVLRRGAILFVVSDFVAGDFRRPMALAASRHDVVAVQVSDPAGTDLRASGLVFARDAESGRQCLIDAGSERVRRAFHARAVERERSLQLALAASGVDRIPVSTTAPVAEALGRFFRARQLRQRR